MAFTECFKNSYSQRITVTKLQSTTSI